jgi:hypothetical protein
MSRLAPFARIVPLRALWLLALPTISPAQQPSDVFVVGTLYRRHAETSAFGLDALRCTIEAIDPEVVVLDVTPKELAEQSVHASKIEYPGVIFPLVKARGLVAYPAEPAEPMFSEIVQGIIRANEALAAKRPAAVDTMQAFARATYSALRQSWSTAADVQSAATAAVLAGKRALEGSLVGPVQVEGSRRWDEHTASVVRRAVGEHPGRRVLVLTGIENRPVVAGELEGAPGVRLVDVERWLREREAELRGCAR